MLIVSSSAFRCLWLAVAVLAATPARAQSTPRDTLLGSAVRVRTTRISGDGVVRSGGAAGAGLLIRRRGDRQRVDVLQAIDDSVGEDWMTGIDSVDALQLHMRKGRRTLLMRFGDLRQVFSSLLQVRFDSASTVAEVLGPGPELLGYATRRVRIVRGFRMQTSRAGKTQVLSLHSETEALVAPDVPESYGSNSALSLTSSSTWPLIEQIFGPGSARVIVRGGGALPTGLALRTVSRTRSESHGASVFPLGDGRPGVMVDSIEVISIARAPVPDDAFVAPAGYTATDFSDEFRKLLAMIDELGAAVGGKGAKPPKALGKPTDKPYKP